MLSNSADNLHVDQIKEPCEDAEIDLPYINIVSTHKLDFPSCRLYNVLFGNLGIRTIPC